MATIFVLQRNNFSLTNTYIRDTYTYTRIFKARPLLLLHHVYIPIIVSSILININMYVLLSAKDKLHLEHLLAVVTNVQISR